MQTFVRRCRAVSFGFALGVLVGFLTSSASAQTTVTTAPESTAQSSDKTAPEVSSHEEITTFKVKVNLVEVRVVVRDAAGHAIGTLKQEDFQLLDNGKPQVISKFSMDQAGTNRPTYHDLANGPGEPPPANPQVVAQRYIAYLFDDIHLSVSDLAQARNAAEHQLQSLQPGDRAAIYSTSGQTQLDFTDDQAQLIATLNRLQPRPLAHTSITPCPNISYYMADMIENKNDPQATQVAIQDASDCGASVGPYSAASVQIQVKAAARQELTAGGQEVRLSLAALQAAVRRLSTMPGQRLIILARPVS